MAQESVLVITVDARNAENRIKAVNSALSSLERSGQSASDSIRNVGQNADKETTRLDKFKTSITNLAAESKLYFAGVSGAAVGAAGALVALAVQTANTAAEIERLAYLSGTTTTEFQEFAVGAKAMGIEMDKLSDIFKDVQDRVGDFITTGGGELSDFFTEIATKTEGSAEGALKLAKSMRELSGPEALQLYVSKLEEAGVSQSEMVFFMESVADEATALIPLLENGGEGFRLWAEAARNAGAIMDDETLAAAQRLKVETQLLEMQMTGLKNQFMSGLLPALNQIASAFTGTTEQTFNLKSAAEGVGNTLIWLTKVGMGVAATFEIAGKVIGGAAAAMTSKEVTHQMVLDDIGKSIDEIGSRYEKLNNPNLNNKLVDSLTKVQVRANENAASVAKAQVNTEKMQETFDKAAGSAAKVKDNTKQLAREAKRAAEEVRKIMYQYSSEESQKAIDLQKEITRLQKYGQTQYIQVAKNRYEEERKLSKMNFEYDLVEFRVSEEQKLRFLYNIKEQEVIADTKLTKEQTQQKLASLKIQFQQEMYDIELAKKQRLFSAAEFQYTEMERIKKRYELEREEIGKTHDVVERNALLQASIAKQRIEEFETLAKYADVIQSTRQSSADELFQKKSPDQYAKFQLQNEYGEASGQLQGAHNDQVAGISLIEDEQARNAQLLEVHEQYLQARQALNDQYAEKERDMQRAQLDLQLASAGSFFGSMTEMLKNSGAERTGIYKVMFATEKALAIARSIIAIQTGIAEASANPFPYNLAAMASVAAATAGIVGNIQSVAGVFHGGKDYVPKEATYLLDKGERVLSPRQNTDLTQYLNSRRENNNPVNITINVPQGYTATEKTDSNGNVTIDVVDKRIRQAFGRINDANSYESKQLQRNTTAKRERM